MLKELKNIRYYMIIMLLAFGLYSYATVTGIRLFGDDNQNTDGQPYTGTGGGAHYYGGHGYYFHK